MSGTSAGQLDFWDVDRLSSPIVTLQAHVGIINCLDCCGSQVNIGTCQWLFHQLQLALHHLHACDT